MCLFALMLHVTVNKLSIMLRRFACLPGLNQYYYTSIYGIKSRPYFLLIYFSSLFSEFLLTNFDNLITDNLSFPLILSLTMILSKQQIKTTSTRKIESPCAKAGCERGGVESTNCILLP